MFVIKKDLNITKKIEDLLNQRCVDRFFSLTTSVVFLLWSLKVLYLPIIPATLSLYDFITIFVGFLFLLSSILLFLDFLNLNFFLVRKKIWLPMFLMNCVIAFVYIAAK